MEYNSLKKNTKAMINVNFYRVKTGSIRLTYSVWGKKRYYYIGVSVDEKQWDKRKQRLKPSKDIPHAALINAAMDRMDNLINELHIRCKMDMKPFTDDLVREKLNETWVNAAKPKSEKNSEKPQTMTGYIIALADKREKMGEIKPNTAKGLRLLASTLKRYEKDTGKRVSFERLDLEFHANFSEWMTKQQYNANYLHKSVSRLKLVAKYALDDGIAVAQQVHSPRFAAKKHDSDTAYLTTAQLEKIERLDLSERLDRVRDAFLLAAYTGLRFSDLSRLRAHHLAESADGAVIQITTQKTAQAIVVPVLPSARRVLDKNGGNFPAQVTNQEMNRCLKEICKAAGLEEKVSLTKHQGGMMIEYSEPLYNLVSTHTARRSFATNEYLLAIKEGRSIRPIMAILGHKTESAFMRYIRISQKENAVLFMVERGKKQAV